MASRGETPEEIIAKGQALQEIKKIRPWKHQGLKGGFAAWAKLHLPYRAARAHHYIRIAAALRLDQVRGKKICFEALLEISKAPAEMHQQMIVAAEGGASARALRRMAQGEEAAGPEDPVARAERILRQQKRLSAELRLLVGQTQGGAQVPDELLRQIGEGDEVQRELVDKLGRPSGEQQGTPPAAGPAQQGPEPDPNGSTSAAPEAPPASSSPPVATLQLPADVLALRPLFRFFHDELTPGRKDAVQDTLASVIRGDDRAYRILEMHRELRPFLLDGHPMKKLISKMTAGLRADGMAGRQFALYCLLAARLPGFADKLEQLAGADLPGGLGELVRTCRDLLMSPA